MIQRSIPGRRDRREVAISVGEHGTSSSSSPATAVSAPGRPTCPAALPSATRSRSANRRCGPRSRSTSVVSAKRPSLCPNRLPSRLLSSRLLDRRAPVMRYAYLMKRTTVMFPDEVDARLRLEARRRGIPIAEVVREAVECHLPAPEPGRPLSFFGVGAGGPADASERVDEYVGRAVRRRRRG